MPVPLSSQATDSVSKPPARTSPPPPPTASALEKRPHRCVIPRPTESSPRRFRTCHVLLNVPRRSRPRARVVKRGPKTGSEDSRGRSWRAVPQSAPWGAVDPEHRLPLPLAADRNVLPPARGEGCDPSHRAGAPNSGKSVPESTTELPPLPYVAARRGVHRFMNRNQRVRHVPERGQNLAGMIRATRRPCRLCQSVLSIIHRRHRHAPKGRESGCPPGISKPRLRHACAVRRKVYQLDHDSRVGNPGSVSVCLCCSPACSQL